MSNAEFMASILVPSRRHPYGDGWGPGRLEWPQKEGFSIRHEVEWATAEVIRRVGP